MEKWKKINDFYEVSDLGRVRSLDCYKKYKLLGNECVRFKKGKILLPIDNGKGYLSVNLGKGKRQYIHRLVAEAFLENKENKCSVNHKDGDKSNNKLENLEWCTKSENTRHGYDNGLLKNGENRTDSKLTNEQVIFIRNNYIPRHKEFGCNAMARKFGVSGSIVCNILKNKIWKRV